MDGVLYELTYQLPGNLANPFIVLIGFLAVTLREIKAIRQKGSVKGHLFEVCVLPLALVLLAIVCCVAVVKQVDLYRKIVVPYRQNRYETVEGYVENFEPMPYTGHAQESFEIDGVLFEYSDYSSEPGYQKTRSHGGVVSGDGQYLTVGYIYYEPDARNIIVYIGQSDPPTQ